MQAKFIQVKEAYEKILQSQTQAKRVGNEDNE